MCTSGLMAGQLHEGIWVHAVQLCSRIRVTSLVLWLSGFLDHCFASIASAKVR